MRKDKGFDSEGLYFEGSVCCGCMTPLQHYVIKKGKWVPGKIVKPFKGEGAFIQCEPCYEKNEENKKSTMSSFEKIDVNFIVAIIIFAILLVVLS